MIKIIKIPGPSYIHLFSVQDVCYTEQLAPDVYADYDEEDNLIGIEILYDVEARSDDEI